MRSPAVLLALFFMITWTSGCRSGKGDTVSERSPAKGPVEPRADVVSSETRPRRAPAGDPVADPPDDDSGTDQDGRDYQDDQSDQASEEEPESPCYGGSDGEEVDPFICDVELAILDLTNDVRAPQRPFQLSKKMSFVARLWSETQAGRNSIGHEGFPGRRGATYREEFGEQARLFAENVAVTYAGGEDAQAVARAIVDMWAGSLGHRLNMLGDYPYLGVGVARRGSQFYATQIFGDE